MRFVYPRTLSIAAIMGITTFGCGTEDPGNQNASETGSTGETGSVESATGGAATLGSGGQGSGGSTPISSGGAPSITGSGGQGAGAAPGTGGAESASGGASSNPGSGLGYGMQSGSGMSSEQYETAFVSRNDVDYVLITNGWGPGFDSHTIAWEGTSFIVQSSNGSSGANGQPSSYPTVFCGRYSVRDIPECGLPAPMDSITSLKTGWRWKANDSGGEYNAAYDIWVGDGMRLQGYLMVWLHDPAKYQPAGSLTEHLGVSVEGLPGVWDIWQGTVNGLPIINWVRAEGDDLAEIEFDVMDVLADAKNRGMSFPGTHINAVAVGFEIWDGPVTNVESEDFYVEVNP